MKVPEPGRIWPGQGFIGACSVNERWVIRLAISFLGLFLLVKGPSSSFMLHAGPGCSSIQLLFCSVQFLCRPVSRGWLFVLGAAWPSKLLSTVVQLSSFLLAFACLFLVWLPGSQCGPKWTPLGSFAKKPATGGATGLFGLRLGHEHVSQPQISNE